MQGTYCDLLSTPEPVNEMNVWTAIPIIVIHLADPAANSNAEVDEAVVVEVSNSKHEHHAHETTWQALKDPANRRACLSSNLAANRFLS